MKGADNVVAINVGKSLMLLNVNDPENPIELTFQSVRHFFHYFRIHEYLTSICFSITDPSKHLNGMGKDF